MLPRILISVDIRYDWKVEGKPKKKVTTTNKRSFDFPDLTVEE
jgi:hypothetical protein